MVILIVGGEYGTPASGEKKDGFKEYISITRNEFRATMESGIPILVMIDKKVMAEYGVYEANHDDIENKNRMMAFPTTKSINVFRFIKEIKGIVTLPIQEFEQSSDIKGFVSKQWADMFKNYLSSLRNEKENKKIENSVNEMKALIQKMSIMLDSVGKNVLLKDNPKEYEDVINKQVVLEFCDSLIKTFSWDIGTIDSSFDNRKEFVTRLLDCLLELNEKKFLTRDFSDEDIDGFFEVFHRHKIAEPLSFWGYDIKEKMDLLSDSQNKSVIIDTMMKDEYFDKLIRFYR